MKVERREIWKVLIFAGFFVMLALFVSIGCASGATAPEEEWNRTFGGSSYDYGLSVQQTTDGGYIITGDTCSFGTGRTDVWLVKTASDGMEEWNRTFGKYPNFQDHGYSVQQTTDGGYIIAGSAPHFDKISVWLIKTAANGAKNWDRTFGGYPDDQSYSVQQTTDGG